MKKIPSHYDIKLIYEKKQFKGFFLDCYKKLYAKNVKLSNNEIYIYLTWV